jgi:hypothetical protein
MSFHSCNSFFFKSVLIILIQTQNKHYFITNLLFLINAWVLHNTEGKTSPPKLIFFFVAANFPIKLVEMSWQEMQSLPIHTKLKTLRHSYDFDTFFWIFLRPTFQYRYVSNQTVLYPDMFLKILLSYVEDLLFGTIFCWTYFSCVFSNKDLILIMFYTSSKQIS